jgi:hypothetical protein
MLKKILVSISGSVGVALLGISILSIIRSIKIFSSAKPQDGIWAIYMDGFYYYLNYLGYIFSIAFILYILFYVIEIHRNKVSS